ncbi:MAG: 3-hydroxyacyl-CoA dehydrogenase [Anaplasma sp.]
MQIGKVLILDPALSSIGIIDSLVAADIGVVLYCSDTASASDRFGKRVEVRDFGPGRYDFEAISCVVELIDGNVQERAKFYSSVAVPDEIVVLCSDVGSASWDALCSAAPKRVLPRLVAVRFPTFFRGGSVLECATNPANSAYVVDAIKRCFGSKLTVLAHSCGGHELFDRIGYLWTAACLSAACECGVEVEVADHMIASEHTGVSFSGVFSVLDSLMLDSFVRAFGDLTKNLEKKDPLLAAYTKLPGVLHSMVSDGLTGSGSRGGFYRVYDMRDGQIAQVIDLSSGLYRGVMDNESLQSRTGGKYEKFFRLAWGEFFAYIEYLIQCYGAGVVGDIDAVLRLGYRWKYGVKELAGKVGIQFATEVDRGSRGIT